MRAISWRWFCSVLLAGLVVVPLGCRGRGERKKPLQVFYASSLEGAVERWGRMFREREGVAVRSESSGSQVAVRKVSELGRAADLVLVADYHVIDWLLMPDHARWQVLFAANEIVLAHSEQSRYAAELSTATWRAILLRPDVRVARANENLAPIGYQTLQTWALSDLEAGIATTDTERSLTAQLRRRIPPELVQRDVKSLAGTLGLRVDYVFVFRSIAHEHNLKYLRLPVSMNLSDPNRAADYARAAVTIVKSTRGTEPEEITVRGGPILYGLTIPRSAPQPELAARFVEMILSEEGQNVLEDLGFSPVRPARGVGVDKMPEGLQSRVKVWNEDSAN